MHYGQFPIPIPAGFHQGPHNPGQMPYQQPPGPPVVILNQMFCVQQPTTLILRERVDSRDDFAILDAMNREWFKLDAKNFSMSDQRTLYDIYRNPLVVLKKKMFSMGNKWQATRPTGEMLYTVEPKIFTLSPSINIYLNDGDRQPDFQIKGTYMAKDFQIYDLRGGGQRLIAQCSKTRPYQNPASFMMQQMYNVDEYYVTVHPGIDAAFVTSLCLLLDEIYHDK